MDMHEMEQLLKSIRYKAPENFTSGVMQKIHSCSESRKRAELCYRTGISLIAAGLIVLFLNLTPLMDFLIEHGNAQIDFSRYKVDPYRTAGSIEYFTLKADSFLLKPFQYISNQVNKEDLQYDKSD
ncbi:MAG TPA: hypothetical protein GXZ29_11475 [Clostridiales bacterium]|jgi:hypothetical protein|nr:hypothetical protein [Clostridiales bacterium]